MPVSVVDALEVVNVNHDYGERRLARDNIRVEPGGVFVVGGFVFETGERVFMCQFVHDGELNFRPLEILEVMHAVGSRLEERGI